MSKSSGSDSARKSFWNTLKTYMVIGRITHPLKCFCGPSWILDGADAFKLTLYLIYRGLEGMDARVVHTQHDEIIVEARDAIEDQVKAIMKECMEAAFERNVPEVPFGAEIRVDEAWKVFVVQQIL